MLINNMDYMTLKGEKWGDPSLDKLLLFFGPHYGAVKIMSGSFLRTQKSPLMAGQKKQGAIAMENRIILIEDDEEIRSMVKDYLSGEFQVL